MTTPPRSLILTVLAAATLATACGKKDGGGGGSGGADTTAPVPGQLLDVAAVGATSAQLTWAPAEDDETAASALAYQVYRSLENDLNNVAALEANGTPVGTPAPGIVEATVGGLDSGTIYFFSVMVRDEAGNAASYSAVPAITTAGCTAELPVGGCPAADPGHVTACGRIADVETNEFLEAAAASGDACEGAPAASGPCSVAITVYDTVEFASNPSTATPLVPDEVTIDDCGRFRVANFPQPSLGSFALVVEDAAGTSDRHRPTMVAAANAPTVVSMRAFVTRNETDTAWSSAAGLVGPSFASQGVVMGLFQYAGAGRAGVQFTRNGSGSTTDDHYFSDAGASRSTVAPGLAATGSNGGALFVGSALVPHSGSGGEPPSCEWPAHTIASVPGVVFVQTFDAEILGGGAVCP